MFCSRLRSFPCQHPSADSIPAPDLLHEDDNTEFNESPEELFGGYQTHFLPDSPLLYTGGPGEQVLYINTYWGNLAVAVPTYPSLTDQQLEECPIKVTE